MAAKKIFWEDPYLSETNAVVTSVDNDIIILDRTIAYAFSGGQQSDSGTIRGYEILDARKDNTEIYYKISPDHRLKEGQEVIVKIDWEKRYRIMKLHFAAELVLELVYQEFERPEKISANITSEKARLDFFWQGNISEIFPVLEAKINELREANRKIISEFADRENEERYWEIEGFAKVACGGTHLKETGEIGPVALKRVNIGGGKERIEIYLQSD